MHGNYVSVEGVSRRYPGHVVFRDLHFGVRRGEFVCLVGHSGCGKTTVLNILAGLDAPDGGGVIVDGQEIAGPSLDRAAIFRSHALMPWLTAEGNVAFALSCRHRNWPRARGCGKRRGRRWRRSGWAKPPTASRRSSRAA